MKKFCPIMSARAWGQGQNGLDSKVLNVSSAPQPIMVPCQESACMLYNELGKNCLLQNNERIYFKYIVCSLESIDKKLGDIAANSFGGSQNIAAAIDEIKNQKRGKK